MSAQSAAHLATSNVNRPSIFELVASQSLDATFYPAISKIANVFFLLFVYIYFSYISVSLQFLGGLNPDRYQVLVKHYDEIFFLLNGLLQHYYLKKQGELRI